MHTGSKVWLITGSSRGLDRAFAQAALEAGHRVVATARNPLQLNDIVSRYGDGCELLRWMLLAKSRRSALSTQQLRPLASWMCLSTMPAMATYVPWKIPHSLTFGHRSRRIFLVSSS